MELQGKYILDIGGNTGFFSFESILNGGEHVDFYEGNVNHAQFVNISSQYFKLEKKIRVYNEYYSFGKNEKKYDIIFLMNVLHHVGDDYENSVTNIMQAKKQIMSEMNNESYNTEYMVFQLGYNWKGNRELPLFEAGTKFEMIEYIRNGIKGYWDIESIGIPEIEADEVVYKDLNEYNIERQEELGEFLNRPLFILKSTRSGR